MRARVFCGAWLLILVHARPQDRDKEWITRLLHSKTYFRPPEQPQVVYITPESHATLSSEIFENESGTPEPQPVSLSGSSAEETGEKSTSSWRSPQNGYVLAFINVSYPDPVTGRSLHRSGEIGKYSTGLVAAVSGRLVHATSGKEAVHHGCDPVWEGLPPHQSWVALVQRGNCNFGVKVENAYRQGASAVVIYDYRDGNHLHQILLDGKHRESIVTVFIPKQHGEELAHLVDAGNDISIQISPGKHYKIAGTDLNKTTVLFVAVSFILLMGVSFAWLLFYYLQRFRYDYNNDQLRKRLVSAAKKTLSQIPMKTLKPDDVLVAEAESCAVCLEPFSAGEQLRQLPCSHEFHYECVDPWLLQHRTCPMCKMDILKYFGLRGVSEESLLELDLEATPASAALRRPSSVLSDGRRLSDARARSLSRTSHHDQERPVVSAPAGVQRQRRRGSSSGATFSGSSAAISAAGVRSRRVSSALQVPRPQRETPRRFSAPSQDSLGPNKPHLSLGRSISSPPATDKAGATVLPTSGNSSDPSLFQFFRRHDAPRSCGHSPVSSHPGYPEAPAFSAAHDDHSMAAGGPAAATRKTRRTGRLATTPDREMLASPVPITVTPAGSRSDLEAYTETSGHTAA